MTRGPIDTVKGRQTGALPQAQTRILVVEDSPTQAEALRALLEGAGYKVALASSGENGLAQLDAQEFDVVISDIVMPGTVDGYELCRRIKAGTRRATPVVLLTSLSDPLDIIRGLECGADNFFTKGVDPAHLLDRLKLLRTTRETRAQSKFRMGVSVFFMGHDFTITSEREQILDLLISTFEDAVRQNRKLREREDELEVAKAALARHAGTLEERLQQVLNAVPDMLFSVDATITELYYLSPACTDIVGLTPEEVGSDASLLLRTIHPDDQPRVMAVVQEALRTGRPGTMECRVRHADGTIRWLRTTVVPAAGERGTAVRLDGIARDITNERQLEEQLRLAQKMEAVGTLAGGVAHDFNNLLAAIRSTVDLVLMDLEAESPVRKELEEVGGLVDRAAALTRQLLAFGRKQVLEARALDLNALISGTVTMLERIIGEDVRLVLRETTDATTVMADPGQLEQVLMNLCVNARDAMPKGGELAILTERVGIDEDFCVTHPWARPGDYVRLTVSDTGVGIDAVTQARIFEPFFTTKELGRGTGLGLAVVYGIVKQHAGLIHVYSEMGKGTTFRVYLPFDAAAPEAIAVEAALELVGGTETILLAEDDAVLRATVSKLLERLGYHVIAAASGEEALKRLAERGDAIHLAVLDIVMPGIGGQQVFEQVHARYPDLRFLFTTGYSPGTSHTEPIRTLPVEVLPKPYGLQALARTVRRALAGGQGRG